jgi:hypothetical protein
MQQQLMQQQMQQQMQHQPYQRTDQRREGKNPRDGAKLELNKQNLLKLGQESPEAKGINRYYLL